MKRDPLEQWRKAVESVEALSTPTMALKSLYPAEYQAWRGIRDRCFCKRNKDYAWYGAIGIRICKRWDGVDGFQRFMHDMGPKPPGKVLARRDVRRDYTPANTFWGDRLEQLNNRTSARMLTIDGRTQSAASWARETGLPRRQTVTNRLQLGWHPKAAVFGKMGETIDVAHERLGVKRKKLS